MKKWFCGLLLLAGLESDAQNTPAFRQFYFNPYLFNPAYAGIEGYSELFVYHRQQWLNFNDAPTASGFNLQYPTQNRVAYGFNVTNQDVVAYRNSSAVLTFAYRFPVSPTHYFSFGISGGMGFNTLNLDPADYSNDPTILAAMDNTYYADGNFGALYTLGNLRIGFALPRLFGSRYYSPQDLGTTRFAQLRNQLYSVTYKINLGTSGLALEPYLLYRMNRDLQNFWEASALLNFKGKIWVGNSYHESQGIGFFLGMDVKEKLRFSYSYELPPVSSDFIAASSHEFHLQIRMGKRKIFKWAATAPIKEAPTTTRSDPKPVIAETVSEQPKDTQPESPLPKSPTPRKVEENRVVILDEIIPKPESTTEEDKRADKPVPETTKPPAPPRQHVLAPGHYVIVASLSTAQNGLQERDRFIRLGYDAFMAQNPVNRKFYVYIFASIDVETARQTRDYYRLLEASQNAWVLSIQ